MYGAGTQAAVSDAPVRQIQSIHSDTLECLTTAIRGLDALIAKTIGPEPINANEKPPMPIRSMQGDAENVNEMAHKILARLERLHNSFGYDKQ